MQTGFNHSLKWDVDLVRRAFQAEARAEARVVNCCWCDSGIQVTCCAPDLRRLGPEYT